jgi:hypothetical protein
MNQLFTALPAGAFKEQAKATLKQDIIDAITAEIAKGNANINSHQAAADTAELQITQEIIAPLQADQANVNDTTLP